MSSDKKPSDRKSTPETFNAPAPGALKLLLTRRSGSAKAMEGPGPGKKQLADILQAGARAPDHGKLFPWRFIVFEGKGRERAGDILADVLKAEGEREKYIAEERGRFLRAPVVIGVVSSARELHKVPVWEQELSAGAVCQNILIAATALGFVANWLTEWYAFHPLVKERLGLKPGERIAGFIYIGTAKDPLEERPRPDMEKIVSRF
ncbi:MAG TPA: nitroreductase [Rhizomicrobium sp.]|jgi:nitroreductase|nr:nitroreductase [Rhizomicrobium sp.]